MKNRTITITLRSRSKKLQTNLDLWKSRNWTLFGKVLIIKPLGLSQLVYSASNLNLRIVFINEARNSLRGRRWKGNGKGKGELLGTPHTLSRAQISHSPFTPKFPLPLLFSTPATQAMPGRSSSASFGRTKRTKSKENVHIINIIRKGRNSYA